MIIKTGSLDRWKVLDVWICGFSDALGIAHRQSRAGSSNAMQLRAGKRQVMTSHGTTDQDKARQARNGQGKAFQETAGQGISWQSKAGRSDCFALSWGSFRDRTERGSAQHCRAQSALCYIIS